MARGTLKMVPQKCKSYFTQIATFGKSTYKFNLSIKPYLKLRSDEHKISLRNWDCDKNKIVKHCRETDHNFIWDQKKVVDRENRLIPHSLKNLNHMNKIYYKLPEIWLPNLLYFLVTYVCHIRRF